MIFKIKIKNGPEIWGFGTFARFSDDEIKEGFHRYSLRHADEDAFEPCTIAENIRVNHYGDIQTMTDLSSILGADQWRELEIEELEEHSSTLTQECGICDSKRVVPAIHKEPSMDGVYRIFCKKCGTTIQLIRAANTLEAMQQYRKELVKLPQNKDAVESIKKVMGFKDA